MRDTLATPDEVRDLGLVAPWFSAMADLLLNRARLHAGSRTFRLTEVEFYYVGEVHKDPFAHQSPLQTHLGRWYLHRAGSGLRRGSFKGLDLTIGDAGADGGLLLRGFEPMDGDGDPTDGPCLLVERLMDATGHGDVADLHAAIGHRPFDAPDSPLHLAPAEDLEPREVLWTARVGLTLKRARGRPTMPRYVGAPYRALTRPRATKKGRLQTILALHQAGEGVDAIRARTGSPRRAIQRHVDHFEAGRDLDGATRFVGATLKSADLAALLGWWAETHGDA